MKPSSPSIRRHRQHGITLIESLISLLVVALGMMGIIGMQMRTLVDTQTGVRRAQAIRLIEDLGERMRVHPNALVTIDAYLSNFEDFPALPTGGCASGCDRAALAAFDVASWKGAVQRQLPLGDAAIFIAPTQADENQRQVGVMVAWRENERHIEDDSEREAYRIRIDATRDAEGNLLSEEVECPAGFTCHLQYLPVGARCPSSPNYPDKFFCPGA